MTLDEVRITGTKPMYAAEGDKKIYNVSEDPTVQNGSAQDALQNTPGVQVDGEGNITLNGKAVKVYINDKESHYTEEMLKQYIKTLTADQIFSLNYSNFTSRPNASNLSRYERYYIDSYSSGNPLIEPSYSHNLGVSYSKSFEKGHSLGVSGSYTWQINKISSLTMPVYNDFFGHYVSFSQPYNIGNSRDGNVYAYARLRFSALFSMSLSAGLNDNWYRVQVRPDEWVENAMTS